MTEHQATPPYTETQYLRLASRFTRHLLGKYRGNLNALEGTADFCNLWDLLQTGLEGPEDRPQVPLAEIVALVEAQITEYDEDGHPIKKG